MMKRNASPLEETVELPTSPVKPVACQVERSAGKRSRFAIEAMP